MNLPTESSDPQLRSARVVRCVGGGITALLAIAGFAVVVTVTLLGSRGASTPTILGDVLAPNPADQLYPAVIIGCIGLAAAALLVCARTTTSPFIAALMLAFAVTIDSSTHSVLTGYATVLTFAITTTVVIAKCVAEFPFRRAPAGPPAGVR